MNAVPLEYFLTVAGVLFAVGAVGFLLRRNLLVLLMSIEVMLNAVNLTLVAFNRMHAHVETAAAAQHGAPAPMHSGQIFAFFIIVVAAAEAAVGLAIVLSFFRVRKTVRSDDADLLRN
jgi:NADH-quinone oxidoreductase subunit K